MAVKTKAGDILKLINSWTMQEHASELDDKSILHLLDSDAVGAPSGLHDAIEKLLTKKKDSEFRIEPEDLEELEDAIKKHAGKYI
jgi:hypothetical protein